MTVTPNPEVEFVRVRDKQANVPDVSVSRAYAEGLGDAVEILDAPAFDERGRLLEPTPKAKTPKNAAS